MKFNALLILMFVFVVVTAAPKAVNKREAKYPESKPYFGNVTSLRSSHRSVRSSECRWSADDSSVCTCTVFGKNGINGFGSYHVDLPDGRRQHVTYTADV